MQEYCTGNHRSHVAMFARRVVTEPIVMFGTYQYGRHCVAAHVQSLAIR